MVWLLTGWEPVPRVEGKMPGRTVAQTRIGELLTQAGLIDAAALARASEVQKRSGGSLGKALASLGLADENAVSAAIAQRLNLEHLGPVLPEIDPGVLSLIPAPFCREHMVVPLGVEGNSLRLAIVDPLDYATIQDVEFLASKKVGAVVASQSSIQALLGRLYPAPQQQEIDYQMLSGIKPEGEVEEDRAGEYEIIDPAQLVKDTKLPPIVRLVNLILSDAAKTGASDIHVEPQETCLQVRHRIDGQLQDVLKIPKEIQNATISRLKIISGMDIADRRRPQDGRCRLRIDNRRIDLRVSTLPTQFGEKVVIRLLDSTKAQLKLDQLGLTPANLGILEGALSSPQGMILLTGPTGSGKTSTLYTALNWVKSRTSNIITVEDPIEFQLPGINQVQLNPKAGMTFATGLRSILRQDPNIIMVGEIRDRETASIAVEAAQTGHLLLSTVHTNDAPATIARLFDLGIEPFQVAAALLAIVAQRLVRRLCPACAVPGQPSAEAVEKAGGSGRLPPDARWMASRGCEKCNQTGFKGRLAVHEVLAVTDDLRALLSRRAPEQELRGAARAAGMKTLMEDGLAKAAQGLTTLEELVRVVTQDAAPSRQLEVVTQDAAPSSQVELATARRAPLEFVPAQPSSRSERVLIVEDSPTVVAVVRYFMQLEGFEVLDAPDGVAGLEIAKREHPQVVVSDISMPRMDGLSMVKALRADPETANIAVLMLTVDSSVEGETSGLAAGADDYIVKPVEPRRLAARVKALLARSQARQPVAIAAPTLPEGSDGEYGSVRTA